MKKQTAVEWLMEQITYDNGFGKRPCSFNGFADLTKYFDKAKEMEREHIKNAYDHMRCIGNHENGEEYYEQTYGGEKE